VNHTEVLLVQKATREEIGFQKGKERVVTSWNWRASRWR